MNVKGKIAISISNFLKQNHPRYFEEWFKTLPESSKEVYSNRIYSSSWYLSDEAFIIPVRILSHIIFKDEITGAGECGSYHAQREHSGVNRILLKLYSPKQLIGKGCRTFINCFAKSKVEIVNYKKHKATLKITKLDNPDLITENWFIGWLNQSLKLSGCKNVVINKPKSLAYGDSLTEITISWR